MNRDLETLVDQYIRKKHYRLINSVLLYKDGELLCERYYNGFTESSRNNIKSIWKSILSICVGICLDQGFIKSLDDPIADYLDEFARNTHLYHMLITIRHLLTMSSGIYWNGGVHYHSPMLEQLWRSQDCLGHLADTAMMCVPGISFVYKEWDVILLSAVIGKASGMNAYEFCKRYLYDPLNINSGEWACLSNGVSYTISKNPGIEARSDLSARDLAKLGHLLTNNGQGIVSEGYIREAVSPSACSQEYGFLIWLSDGGYACRGYGGQEINVLPGRNIVYVIQATPTPRSKQYGDVFKYIAASM